MNSQSWRICTGVASEGAAIKLNQVMRYFMDKTSRPIVFLDTNVLISAFDGYRKKKRLPFYLSDPEARRFTFEKCIFEAYMVFRGVIKKEGKWAQDHLDKNNDPRPLNDLINKYHRYNNENNLFEGNYWINNIEGNEWLVDFYEDALKDPLNSKNETLLRNLKVFKGLVRNRNLFEKLCDEFNKMLKKCDIRILMYSEVFCTKENELFYTNTIDLIWMLDTLGRTIIVPSEDLEIVFAAMWLRADIFVTDDDSLIEHSPSLGLNLPLSAASFCRGNPKEVKNNDEKSGEKESSQPRDRSWRSTRTGFLRLSEGRRLRWFRL